VLPIAMGRPVSAMGARRPAPPLAGTTAALRGVAAPPGQGEEVSLRAGQAGSDRPVRRRVLPDRVASRRTVAAAKVCKDVRADRAAGRRFAHNART
jgi:hypothetical protein